MLAAFVNFYESQRQAIGYRQARRPTTSAMSPRKLSFAGGLGLDELGPPRRPTTQGEPTLPNDAKRNLVPQQQQSDLTAGTHADENVMVRRQLIRTSPTIDILTDPSAFHSSAPWFQESAPVQGQTHKRVKPPPAQKNQNVGTSAHLPVAIGTPAPRAAPGRGGVDERRIPVEVEDDNGLVVAVIAGALRESDFLRSRNADGSRKAIVGEEASR